MIRLRDGARRDGLPDQVVVEVEEEVVGTVEAVAVASNRKAREV